MVFEKFRSCGLQRKNNVDNDKGVKCDAVRETIQQQQQQQQEQQQFATRWLWTNSTSTNNSRRRTWKERGSLWRYIKLHLLLRIWICCFSSIPLPYKEFILGWPVERLYLAAARGVSTWCYVRECSGACSWPFVFAWLCLFVCGCTTTTAMSQKQRGSDRRRIPVQAPEIAPCSATPAVWINANVRWGWCVNSKNTAIDRLHELNYDLPNCMTT